jgi:hypothetical protein
MWTIPIGALAAVALNIGYVIEWSPPALTGNESKVRIHVLARRDRLRSAQLRSVDGLESPSISGRS